MSITFDPKGIWRNRKLRLLQLVHDLKSMFSKSQLNSCISIFKLNKHNESWFIKCLKLFCRYLFSSLSCLRDLDMMTMFLGELDNFNTLTMSGTKLPGEFDTFFLSSPCLLPLSLPLIIFLLLLLPWKNTTSGRFCFCFRFCHSGRQRRRKRRERNKT